jgi:hydroxyacylglutathione hydrolase
MTADQPSRPANFANIVAINQGRRPLALDLPASRPLAAGEVARLCEAGHVVIDTRRGPQFASGHLPGALNVQLASPEFEQRVGWAAPPDAEIVLVLDLDEEAPAAMRALAFVGLDSRVSGHLAGGVLAWTAAGRPLEALDEIDVLTLRDRLARKEPIEVVDVRERTEWSAGHIPGARQLSYKTIAARRGDVGITVGGTLAIVCQSGGRSTTASSLLQRAGARNVVNVTGGTQAWAAAGLPVERGSVGKPA